MVNKPVILKQEERFPKATLREPSTSGYLLAVAEVDRRPPFLGASKRKRGLLAECKRQCRAIRQEQDVLRATVFRSILIPPRESGAIRGAGAPPRARYDVAVFTEARSLQEAENLRASSRWMELERRMREVAVRVHVVLATNAKQIAPVDHDRGGVYLLNYFVAADLEQNLAIWEHTAGWFQKHTGLDNSEVLLPEGGDDTPYSIINHCRWDRLWDVLPPLLLRRSARTYVLDQFEANQVRPMPVLYRLA